MLENSENTNDYFNIFLVFVGWLLGILSTLIIEIYKKRRSKIEIKKGINAELAEFRLRLAATNLELMMGNAEITLDYAKWIKPYYRDLFESDIYDYMRTVPKIDMTITNLKDEEFLKCLIESQNRKKANLNLITTPAIPKFELPYLESKYASISLFKESFALSVSQLRREIININYTINEMRYYHNKTFDSLSDSNRQVVEYNIKAKVESMTRGTKYLIKLVEKILKQIGV